SLSNQCGHRFRFNIRHYSHSRQDLFSDFSKHRSSNITTVIQTGRFIHHYDDNDLWIANWREAHEGSNVFRLRISTRLGIDLLGRSSFSRGRVTIQLRFLGCPVQGHTFQHSAQCCCRFRTHDTSLFWLRAIDDCTGRIPNLTNQVRRYPHPVVSKCAKRSNHLHRCHTNFLAHRNRTNRRWLPAFNFSQDADRLARQLNTSLRTKTKPSHEVVHRRVANTQAQLYGCNVARLRQCFGHRQGAKRVVIVNQPTSHSN